MLCFLNNLANSEISSICIIIEISVSSLFADSLFLFLVDVYSLHSLALARIKKESQSSSEKLFRLFFVLYIDCLRCEDVTSVIIALIRVGNSTYRSQIVCELYTDFTIIYTYNVYSRLFPCNEKVCAYSRCALYF